MKYVIIAFALWAVPAQAEVKKGDHFVELDAKTAAGKHFRLKDMAGARGAGGAIDAYPSGTLSLGANY